MKLFPPIAACAMLALAGCASNDTSKMFCPQPAVLQQAQTLTVFLPGRSDIGAEVTQAQITAVAGSCTLHPAKRLLDVKLQAGFTATNGPANQSKPVTLPYFIAITDGETIIAKTDYSMVLNFEDGVASATATSKPAPSARRSISKTDSTTQQADARCCGTQADWLSHPPISDSRRMMRWPPSEPSQAVKSVRSEPGKLSTATATHPVRGAPIAKATDIISIIEAKAVKPVSAASAAQLPT